MDLSATSLEITLYDGSSFSGFSKVKSRPIKNLTLRTIHAPEANFDLFWHPAWFFAPRNNPHPKWSGYMMHVTPKATTLYESASVKLLPIIDLNPSDEKCIYSTLLFVIEEPKKLNILFPCIPFDQPLWQKAVRAIKGKNLQMVCRLGGFHILMSFLGSIGKLMNGSGLEEAFEEVYSENTIKHILSGHRAASALGHIYWPRLL